MTHDPNDSAPEDEILTTPPLEDLGIEQWQAPSLAGGPKAVLSSMKFMAEETGLVKGALVLNRMNQKKGFDCPGCAWPDPDDKRSPFEFCENGVKAMTEEATEKRIGPDFFNRYSLGYLSNQSDHWMTHQGRLTQPMYKGKNSNHYEPISYEKATRIIANELNLAGADRSIFYTSGRTSNEAAFLYQLFVRCFGSNHLPDCSNLCHESSGVGLKGSIGVGKGTVTLKDFEYADCILVVGQNPGTNHPRMLSTLQKAKRYGAKIISMNPLNEAGLKAFKHPQEIRGWIGSATKLTDLHLPLMINSDLALFQGIAKLYFEKEEQSPGFLDHDFINQYCEGFEEFQSDVQNINLAQICEITRLSKDQILECANMMIQAENMIICWAMGLTQHVNAVGNIQALTNLLLMRGQLGKRGSGVCPVRGHSNVQGDRTMGIWERPSEAFLNRLETEFKVPMPREHGYAVVHAIEAMLDSKVDVLFCLGGNLLSASPDTERTALAIKNTNLSVQVSTKLNRSHLVTGKQAIILPCLSRSEVDSNSRGQQFLTVENSMGIVHQSQGHLKPAHRDLQSEVEIIGNLAHHTLGNDHPVPFLKLCTQYDLIRDRIAKVIPGFENFNHRIREEKHFYLPNPVRDQRIFPTIDGKAHFQIHPLPDTRLPEGKFLMMTIRSHDQYNTTIYGLQDRYRGLGGNRRVVLINPLDMKRMNLKERQKVTLISYFESEERKARDFACIPYEIPKGCLATYFPEANPLIPLGQRAHKSHTPASKSVLVSISR